MQNECQKIEIEDANGGAMELQPGFRPHLITLSPSDYFLNGLAKAAMIGTSDSDVVTRYREILSGCYKADSRYYPSPDADRYRPDLAKWRPLAPDYSVSALEVVMGYLRFGQTQYFRGYTNSVREKDLLIQATQEFNARAFLTSGIPFPARARFVSVARFLKEVLHPEFGVVLNPDTSRNLEYISGVHTKLATALIHGQAKVAECDPEEFLFSMPEDQQEPKVDVFLRDDDLGVCAWISYVLGLKTYLTVSMEEARRQNHGEGVKIPQWTEAMIRTGKVPVSDPDGTEMLADMANPGFHNHPIIRVDHNGRIILPYYRRARRD